MTLDGLVRVADQMVQEAQSVRLTKAQKARAKLYLENEGRGMPLAELVSDYYRVWPPSPFASPELTTVSSFHNTHESEPAKPGNKPGKQQDI
jgi:hypothetical protein